MSGSIKSLSDILYMHLRLQAVDKNQAEVTRYLLKSKEIREVLDSNNADARYAQSEGVHSQRTL
jgi:hypothetical protein